MTKRLVDIDDVTLDRAKLILGTGTITETVDAALGDGVLPSVASMSTVPPSVASGPRAGMSLTTWPLPKRGGDTTAPSGRFTQRALP